MPVILNSLSTRFTPSPTDDVKTPVPAGDTDDGTTRAPDGMTMNQRVNKPRSMSRAEVISRAKTADVPQRVQIGPTCGLYALGMVMDSWHTKDSANASPLVSDRDLHGRGKQFTHDPTTDERILDYAKAVGFTSQGEMFRARDLAQTAAHFGYTASIHEQATLEDLYRVLDAGHPAIVAFDVDRNGNPGDFGGSRAHYAVIEGYFDQNGERYLIAKHGWGIEKDHLWRAADFDASWKALHTTDFYGTPGDGVIPGHPDWREPIACPCRTPALGMPTSRAASRPRSSRLCRKATALWEERSLPHRLSVTDFPSFGAPEVITPGVAQESGVRITGVILRGDELVFRRDGGGATGVYAETLGSGSEARLLVGDGECRHINPVVAGPRIALQRVAAGPVPAHVESILFVDESGETLTVPGQSVGVSQDGAVAVVADLSAKILRRVELASGEVSDVSDVGDFVGGIDPQLAPVLALDADGRRVLFMDAREERGDASLVMLELASGARRIVLGPLPSPSWIVGGFAPDGESVIALEMRLGDAPSFRLLRLPPKGNPIPLLALPVTQPATVPAFWDAHTVVVPLSLEPHPLATYGPVDLVFVPISGGAQIPITSSGDIEGTARVDGDRIWVEGGSRVVRLRSTS